jgi:hypothetical protein
MGRSNVLDNFKPTDEDVRLAQEELKRRLAVAETNEKRAKAWRIIIKTKPMGPDGKGGRAIGCMTEFVYQEYFADTGEPTEREVLRNC